MASISAKQWADLISEYKLGGKTQEELAIKYGIAVGTVYNKISELGIKKGDIIKQIESTQAERYRKALADRGYDEEGIVGKITELLEAKQRDPYDSKKKISDLTRVDMGLKQVARFTGVTEKTTQDSNIQDKQVQIKILVCNPNPSGLADVSYEEIKY
jgi:hypothetical protein